MFLFLPRDIVSTDIMCRGVGQHDPRLLFYCLQLVKEMVPLVVGHQFTAAVVIGIGCLVEPSDYRRRLLKLSLVFGNCF